jgi:hypothetical protein
MPVTLHEVLLTEQNWTPLVADCQGLVEQQLSSHTGISATGIKVAYKAMTSFAPGYYQSAIEAMLPEMTAQLEPFWADFTGSGGSSFGDYLAKRGNEVSEALLSVTDTMAATSSKAVLVKAYGAVRGNAAKHIESALPNLGDLVQKYVR